MSISFIDEGEYRQAIENEIARLRAENKQLRDALQAIMGWSPKPGWGDSLHQYRMFMNDMDKAREALAGKEGA